MKTFDAVIVGTGLTARAVSRALGRRGLECTVLVGEGLGQALPHWVTVWSNGIAALRALGVGAENFPHSSTAIPFEQAVFRNAKGDFVQGIQPYVGEHGAWLANQRELETVLEFDARVRRPTSFWHAGSHPRGVEVHTTHGDRIVARMLVGAGGQRCPVRALVRGQRGRRDLHQTVVCGMTHLAEPSLRQACDTMIPVGVALSSANHSHLFVGLRIAEHELFWFVAARHSADIRPTIVQFAEFHDPIPKLLAEGQQLRSLKLFDDLPGLPCAHGPIALAGDAAHLMTPDLGMAGNIGLEDAVTLGDCIALHLELPRPSIVEALRDYQRRRRVRNAVIVESSHVLSLLTLPNHPLLADARDMLLRGTAWSQDLWMRQMVKETPRAR